MAADCEASLLRHDALKLPFEDWCTSQGLAGSLTRSWPSPKAVVQRFIYTGLFWQAGKLPERWRTKVLRYADFMWRLQFEADGPMVEETDPATLAFWLRVLLRRIGRT